MANITLRRGSDPNRPATSSASSMRRWEPFQLIEDLLGWDPFREMTPGLLSTNLAFNPDFEVTENKDSYVFKADMPGVNESDVDISLSGNRLTISGKREQEHTEEHANYYAAERAYGSFSRSFTLPQGADMEHIRAEQRNGVLTVVVPKKPEVQPRKISVSGLGTPAGKPGKNPSA